LLCPDTCNIVANKIIQEFDSLSFVQVRRIKWNDGISSFHLRQEKLNNRMEKLWELSYYFPLDEYEKVKSFVIRKYLQLVDEDKLYKTNPLSAEEAGMEPLSLQERLSQVGVIE